MESLSTNKHQMILRTRKQLIQAQTSPEKPTDNDLQKPIIEPINEFITRTVNPDITSYYVGPMNNVCEYCNAMRFTNESLNSCHNSKVSLPELSPYLEELKDLLISDSVQAKNFRDYIRQYNSAFAFASLGANIDKIKTRGPYCFHIHGQIYH